MLNFVYLTGLLLKAINLTVAMFFIGIVIFVHELGHFIFCKVFGVAVPVFSIGFGPKIFSFKAWDTEFVLSAFPLGGFIQPKDTEENEPDEPSNFAPGKSFHELSYPKRMCMLLGGILFNILFAGLLFSIYNFYNQINEDKVAGLKILQIQNDSPAQKANLRPGDMIVGLNDNVFNYKDRGYGFYRKTVQENLGQEIKVNYKRDGQDLAAMVTLRDGLGQLKNRGAMGLTLDPVYDQNAFVSQTLVQAIASGFAGAASYFVQNMYGIYLLIRHKSAASIDGPASIISEGMALGIKNFLKMIKFFGSVSIGLAVINVLPVAPMDGGKVAVVTIEAIFRRRKIWLVRKLSEAMTLLFLGFAFWILLRDVLKVFFNCCLIVV